MKRRVPQIIQEANAFINGKGHLGVVKKLKVPKIEQEVVEAKGALGGSFAAGCIKPMEMEFTISVVDVNAFVGFGLNTYKKRIPFLFKASVFESGKGEAKPLSLAVTADIIELEIADFESGKECEVNIKLAVHFCNMNINNIPVMLIDVQNMICLIGGVDYLAKVRSNLSE